MTNRRQFLKAVAALGLLKEVPTWAASSQAIAQDWLPRLTHLSDAANASDVFFTTDVSARGLLSVFEQLKGTLTGNVGVKISFETPGGPHLDPQMLKPLCDTVKGTLIDCNGFTPPRDETETHLQVVRQNGFEGIAPIDILDAEGDMDLPITRGYHLKAARTGAHLARYDSLISVVRFKAHHLPRYGGTLKNLSICLGSIAGKALIHSAGATDQYYQSRDDLTTSQAMVDAVKGALQYRPNRWVFINVIDAFEPTDGCDGARNLGNVGIFASTDPVALDQVAIDLTFGAAPDQETRTRWHEYHCTDMTELAEAIGVGRTRYRLRAV